MCHGPTAQTSRMPALRRAPSSAKNRVAWESYCDLRSTYGGSPVVAYGSNGRIVQRNWRPRPNIHHAVQVTPARNFGVSLRSPHRFDARVCRAGVSSHKQETKRQDGPDCERSTVVSKGKARSLFGGSHCSFSVRTRCCEHPRESEHWDPPWASRAQARVGAQTLEDWRRDNRGFGRRLAMKIGNSQGSRCVTGAASRKGRGPGRL